MAMNNAAMRKLVSDMVDADLGTVGNKHDIIMAPSVCASVKLRMMKSLRENGGAKLSQDTVKISIAAMIEVMVSQIKSGEDRTVLSGNMPVKINKVNTNLAMNTSRDQLNTWYVAIIATIEQSKKDVLNNLKNHNDLTTRWRKMQFSILQTERSVRLCACELTRVRDAISHVCRGLSHTFESVSTENIIPPIYAIEYAEIIDSQPAKNANCIKWVRWLTKYEEFLIAVTASETPLQTARRIKSVARQIFANEHLNNDGKNWHAHLSYLTCNIGFNYQARIKSEKQMLAEIISLRAVENEAIKRCHHSAERVIGEVLAQCKTAAKFIVNDDKWKQTDSRPEAFKELTEHAAVMEKIAANENNPIYVMADINHKMLETLYEESCAFWNTGETVRAALLMLDDAEKKLSAMLYQNRVK
jgi:hypothetical protein